MQGFAEGMETLRFSFSLLTPHQLLLPRKTNLFLVKKKSPRSYGKGRKVNSLFNQISGISQLWVPVDVAAVYMLLFLFQMLRD